MNKNISNLKRRAISDNKPELEVRNPRYQFISHATSLNVLEWRIGFCKDDDLTDEAMKLRRQVIAALVKNGLYVDSPSLTDCVGGGCHVSSDCAIENPIQKHGEEFMFSRKGTSPDIPILLSCDKELTDKIEERIVLYLINSGLHIEYYEDREIVGRENRIINGASFDIIIVLVSYFNIFGKLTSQHLEELFFKTEETKTTIP